MRNLLSDYSASKVANIYLCLNYAFLTARLRKGSYQLKKESKRYACCSATILDLGIKTARQFLLFCGGDIDHCIAGFAADDVFFDLNHFEPSISGRTILCAVYYRHKCFP